MDDGNRKREPFRGEKASITPVSIVSQRIANIMAQMDIEPLPRNYALIYEAIANPETGRVGELDALDFAPSQAALDAIGLRWRLPGHLALALQEAEQTAVQVVDRLVCALREERTASSRDVAVLDTFLEALDADPVMSMSALAREARGLQARLGDFGRRTENFAGMLDEALALLGDARLQIGVDRRAMLRDGLTGLPNAAAFATRTAALFEAGPTQVKTAALLIVAVERLTLLTERYGAGIGEKAVKKCAAVFRKSVKKSDIVARVGSYTFGFLLHDATDQNAQAVAARVRDAIQSLRIRLPDGTIIPESLSLSAGIASTAIVTGPQELLHHAEMALTVVRADGRQGILRCTPMMYAQLSGLAME